MKTNTTWAEAFPWLPSKARVSGEAGDGWWNGAIEDADASGRDEAFATIATLAVDRLLKWPIGEVLPHLQPDLPFDDLELTVRARNVLGNAGWHVTGDLLEIPLGEILARRNAGIGTVDSIIRALAQVSTRRDADAEAALIAAAVSGPDETVAETTRWIPLHVRDLQTVAEWHATLGLGARSLFSTLDLAAPSAVTAAHARLHKLAAQDVLVQASVPSVAELLNARLVDFEERTRDILVNRLFADAPLTLDQLGKKHDVTRERVRQIESKARTRLDAAVESEDVVGEVARVVRSHVRGGVLPLSELLVAVPGLAAPVELVGLPAWRVLDRLDDSYEIVDGWCVEPTLVAAKEQTSGYLEDLADAYGVVRLDDKDDPSATGMLPWLADWLRYCGYDVTEGHVLLRTQGVGDEAAALLSIEGAPLTAAELHERLINPRALGSLQNALASDDRFQKVDRTTWALAEWGLQSYASIRDEIGKVLDASDGSIALTEVIASIAGTFSVTESSVIAYASAPPYRIRDGRVERRGKAAVAQRGPAQTRRYFRQGDAWWVRVAITNDHLRGSGWPGQSALAVVAGIRSGERVELPSRLGPQLISWKGIQPAFGTIRRFLLADDIAAGAEVFAVFAADGTFDVRSAPAASDEPLAQALRLVGAAPNLAGEEATHALAAAIEVSEGDLTVLAGAYRARGDQDVADLLDSI